MRDQEAINYAKKLVSFRQESSVDALDTKYLPADRNYGYIVNTEGYSLATQLDCIAEDTLVNDAIDMMLYSAAQKVIQESSQDLSVSNEIGVGAVGKYGYVSDSAKYKIQINVSSGKSMRLYIDRLLQCDNQSGYAILSLDGGQVGTFLQDNSENIQFYIDIPVGEHELIISIDGAHYAITRTYCAIERMNSVPYLSSTSLPFVGSFEYGIDFEAFFMQSPSKIAAAMMQACRLEMSLAHLNTNRINASQRGEEYKAVLTAKLQKDSNLFRTAVAPISQLLIAFDSNFNGNQSTMQ